MGVVVFVQVARKRMLVNVNVGVGVSVGESMCGVVCVFPYAAPYLLTFTSGSDSGLIR